MIRKCNTCSNPANESSQHEFQNKTYGKGMRVVNPSTGTKHIGTCTVCGTKVQ